VCGCAYLCMFLRAHMCLCVFGRVCEWWSVSMYVYGCSCVLVCVCVFVRV